MTRLTNVPPPKGYPDDAWGLLGQSRFSENRRTRMEAAARNRTNHIRLVIQDVHSPHNVAACLRSAEAFGILNVDIVNLRERFRHSGVSRGVESWLRVRKFSAVSACAADLKARGYRIAAAIPVQSSTSLYDLPVTEPIAIVFGNEHKGLAAEWQTYADTFFTIPMVGLVESFNISVSAALTLHEITKKARMADPPIPGYNLSTPQVSELLNEWTCRQISSWPGELDALRNKHLT